AVEMAVRVVAVFDGRTARRETYFSYVRLKGHIERGVATFSLRQSAAGQPVFCHRNLVAAGNFFARCTRPLARYVQRRFTQEALQNVIRHRARADSVEQFLATANCGAV